MTTPDREQALGGWQTHNGGPNPVPGAAVEWRSRAFVGTGEADRLYWGRDHLMPIIAYRVVIPPAPVSTNEVGDE